VDLKIATTTTSVRYLLPVYLASELDSFVRAWSKQEVKTLNGVSYEKSDSVGIDLCPDACLRRNAVSGVSGDTTTDESRDRTREVQDPQ